MTATVTETTHFVWHCAVAAVLLEKFPPTTARNSHLLNAIRKATVTAAGKNGVRYASKHARQIKQAVGKDWHACGLIKEHTIPVGEIQRRVLSELSPSRAAQVQPGATADLDALLATGNLARVQEHSTVKRIAEIVREWTLLTWVSSEDDKRLRNKAANGGMSLHQRMPAGWDGQDRFARYRACAIDYAEI